jgi:hypothetical protein
MSKWCSSILPPARMPSFRLARFVVGPVPGRCGRRTSGGQYPSWRVCWGNGWWRPTVRATTGWPRGRGEQEAESVPERLGWAWLRAVPPGKKQKILVAPTVEFAYIPRSISPAVGNETTPAWPGPSGLTMRLNDNCKRRRGAALFFECCRARSFGPAGQLRGPTYAREEA